MHLPEEGYLLRIFIGESDRHTGKPLYAWIVLQARERELAGATVVRGIMGFGANTRMDWNFSLEDSRAKNNCAPESSRKYLNSSGG